MFRGICSLVNDRILPVFITDGKPTMNKLRGSTMDVGVNRLGQLENEMVELWEEMGVPFLKAKGEADSTLTVLEMRGKVKS
jgi:hypothetical protein